MKGKNKVLLITAVSSALGGAAGASCGSNSWFVVACVSAVIGAIVAWILNGFIK